MKKALQLSFLVHTLSNTAGVNGQHLKRVKGAFFTVSHLIDERHATFCDKALHDVGSNSAANSEFHLRTVAA